MSKYVQNLDVLHYDTAYNHYVSCIPIQVQTTETSLPSQAEIELPPIHMFADYRHMSASSTPQENLTDGLTLKEGSYLNAEAEVGMLEHSLTTDLLNHLVFVQKVFMKVRHYYGI